MDVIHYVGLDVLKQTVSFSVKRPDGRIVSEGAVSADRTALRRRLGELPQPWGSARNRAGVPVMRPKECFESGVFGPNSVFRDGRPPRRRR